MAWKLTRVFCHFQSRERIFLFNFKVNLTELAEPNTKGCTDELTSKLCATMCRDENKSNLL